MLYAAESRESFGGLGARHSGSPGPAHMHDLNGFGNHAVTTGAQYLSLISFHDKS